MDYFQPAANELQGTERKVVVLCRHDAVRSMLINTLPVQLRNVAVQSSAPVEAGN